MTIKNLLALGLFATTLAAAGCGTQTAPTQTAAKTDKIPPAKDGSHNHGSAPHGGTIVELGKYHGEFCVDHAKKTATVYILDDDAKSLVPIKVEKLLLSIKSPSFQVDLKANPQSTDPKGTSSRFVAIHENFAKEQEFEGTISGEIDGKPYLGDFLEEKHDEHKGEDKSDGNKKAVADPKEAEIYLTPGGLYTEADIKANGSTTVSAKYKNLKISHDIKPKAGDKLCPITLTKANSALTWIIGGKSYEFCCPPCVDEFVLLAKEKPGEIKEPGAYIK